MEPIGKLAPGLKLEFKLVTPQLSVAVGAFQVATAFTAFVELTYIFCGQPANTGGVISFKQGSTTTILNVHTDLLFFLS